MQQVEITMIRALKVWWSFVWRVWVIMIPASVVLIIIGVAYFFLSGSAHSIMTDGKIDPKNPTLTGAIFVLVYLVWFPIAMALQVYALKLALKVRWSDFQFVPIATTTIPLASHVPPQVP